MKTPKTNMIRPGDGIHRTETKEFIEIVDELENFEEKYIDKTTWKKDLFKINNNDRDDFFSAVRF